MKKPEVTKLLSTEGFVITNSDRNSLSFKKEYTCGAYVVIFWNSKDNQLLCHWNSTGDFRYSKDFPNVNKFHYGKGTTAHRFDSIRANLEAIEKQFQLK